MGCERETENAIGAGRCVGGKSQKAGARGGSGETAAFYTCFHYFWTIFPGASDSMDSRFTICYYKNENY